jgi:hypothetical protein
MRFGEVPPLQSIPTKTAWHLPKAKGGTPPAASKPLLCACKFAPAFSAAFIFSSCARSLFNSVFLFLLLVQMGLAAFHF